MIRTREEATTARCVASPDLFCVHESCMAWRWATAADTDYGRVVRYGDDPKSLINRSFGDQKMKPTERAGGYCGLAGKPV